MINLINLPEIVFRKRRNQKITKLKKFYILLSGLYYIFAINKTKGNLFCSLINIFNTRAGKIYFENNFYYKQLQGNKIYFPNKRIIRVVGDHEQQFERLFSDYCLEKIEFNSGDLIIDCGANVGELFFTFLQKNIKLSYVGFEPDPEVYDCLNKNLPNDQVCHKIALSNKKGKEKIYLDSEGANSSLENFGKDTFTYVETRTLDSYNFKNIKLLKLEAEGWEPEVLEGAMQTIKHTEYISVDYGNERGIDEKSTKVEVTDFLYQNNYKLIADSRRRKIGLFANKDFNE